MLSSEPLIKSAGAGCLLLSLCLWPLEAQGTSPGCSAPPAFAAQLTAHPAAKLYLQIGQWFDTHHQYKCAADAYRSALQLSPSAEAFLLLGSSLNSAGN